MTREEAISAMGFLKESVFTSYAEDALDMAISALREQEERSKGCEYCTDILEYNQTHTFPKYVSPFCPVCGRRLEEV